MFALNSIPSVTEQSMFDHIVWDQWSAIVIGWCVVSVTVLTLVGQAATLDRGFLSRKGFMDGGGVGSQEVGYSDHNNTGSGGGGEGTRIHSY